MNSEQASVMENHRRKLYSANGDCEIKALEHQQEKKFEIRIGKVSDRSNENKSCTDPPRGAILLIANGEMEVTVSCCSLYGQMIKSREPDTIGEVGILVESIRYD
jgi:hypothetical protein